MSIYDKIAVIVLCLDILFLNYAGFYAIFKGRNDD